MFTAARKLNKQADSVTADASLTQDNSLAGQESYIDSLLKGSGEKYLHRYLTRPRHNNAPRNIFTHLAND